MATNNLNSLYNQALLSGGIGQSAYGLFGDWQNPADAANKYLTQIQQTISPYYQPYITSGQGALSDLQNQYKQLLANPTAIMNMIGNQYQASPGYQYNVSQATKAANQAAAARGMAGSPAEQVALANQISGMSSKDYWNFLNSGLNQFNTGLGIASNLNQQGYGASNELAQSLANMLLTQAGLSYAGTAAQNQQQGGMFGALGDIAGAIGGMTGLF